VTRVVTLHCNILTALVQLAQHGDEVDGTLAYERAKPREANIALALSKTAAIGSGSGVPS
jgi:hypothetical protein